MQLSTVRSGKWPIQLWYRGYRAEEDNVYPTEYGHVLLSDTGSLLVVCNAHCSRAGFSYLFIKKEKV